MDLRGTLNQVRMVVVVPEKSEQVLNQRQFEDYRAYRAQMIRWLLHLGEYPE